MLTFYILLLFVVLYICLRNYQYKTSAKIFIIVSSMALILISGLRHEGVGSDTYAYIMSFENIKYTSWDEILHNFFQRAFVPQEYEERDPGMSVIMKCLWQLGMDARGFLFFVAAFLIIPLGIVVYKFSENLKVVLYTYVFYAGMFYGYLPNSAVRQSMALAFVLWAFLLLRNRRFVFSAIFILAGAIIHRSAFIALPLIPLVFIKKTTLLYNLAMILFFIIISMQDNFIKFALGENNIYQNYGSYYMDNMQEKPFKVILLMLFHYLVSMFYVWKCKNETMQNRIIILSSAACFALVPLIWINPTALRSISYFGIFVPTLLAMACSNMRLGKVLLLSLILLFLYQSDPRESNYHFMWEQMDLPDSYYF